MLTSDVFFDWLLPHAEVWSMCSDSSADWGAARQSRAMVAEKSMPRLGG